MEEREGVFFKNFFYVINFFFFLRGLILDVVWLHLKICQIRDFMSHRLL